MTGLPREPYLPAPEDGDSALWCTVHYLDRAGTREEILRVSSASDKYLDWERRISHDNGRTFGPRQVIADVVQRLPGGGLVTYPGGGDVDPQSGIRYECRMRRCWPGLEPFTFNWKDHRHPFTDHCFVVEHRSGSQGDSGSNVEIALRYEDGPEWDADHPFDPAFAAVNRAYLGNGFAFGEDGSVFLPLICNRSELNRPAPNRTMGDDHEAGLVLMRRDPTDGQWHASNCIHLTKAQSSRGLLEPDVTVLADGRLLIICRGSNSDTTPGCKWVTTSTDGGRTLAPMRELKYDDGSGFFSPSSIHRLRRSRRNGRLYWLANITAVPPQGNEQRYPLYLAEIDEDVVAVRRDSLILVDDRRPEDSERLQLSNFSLVEDVETDRFEIYLTRIGADAEHFWRAGVDRYVFEPPQS